MSRRKFWLRTGLVAMMLIMLMTGTALATVSDVISRDSNKNDYIYNYEDIIESYTRRVMGLDSVLYDDYAKKTVVAVSSKTKNNYINYEDIISAYTAAIVQGKSFDMVKYLESSGAKTFKVVTESNLVSLKNNKVIYTALNPPATPPSGDLADALTAVNGATSVNAMITALTKNATALKSDGERFKKLHNFAQNRVASRMLARRTFSSISSLTTAFKEELDLVATTIIITYTDYGHTLNQIVNIQSGRSPQTDLYGGGWKTADANIVRWHVDPDNFQGFMLPAATINGNNVNVREGPSTNYSTVGSPLQNGNGPYYVLNEASDGNYTWYRIMTASRIGWVRGDLLNLTTRKGDSMFQFLVLSGNAGCSIKEVNDKILKGKGILAGHAAAFIEGSATHNINEVFLLSLALHESGNGTSKLATGVEWDGKDGVKTVYNMYGIGAVDSDPLNKGAEYAYNQGWFTPEDAIIGGARFASVNYIQHPTHQQDTLYKMRWNPANPGTHQYATDVGWAAKQVTSIMQIYAQLETYTLRFDIPNYK